LRFGENIPATILHWSHELNFLLLEGAKEAFITDVAESVEGNFGCALRDENRVDGDVVHAIAFAKVIDQIARAQNVKSCQATVLGEFETREQREQREQRKDVNAGKWDVDQQQTKGFRKSTPAGSSWFPWIENTGIATLKLGSS